MINSPDIFFLMETKKPDSVVREDLKWMLMENDYLVSPHSPGGGGLYLAWKKEVEISIKSSTNNFIDTAITYKGTSFHATFVYGEPDHTKRQAVWSEISTLQT